MRHKWSLLLGTLAISVALASATGSVAAMKSFTLKGLKDSPTATGTAVIDGEQLTISAKGLKPAAVYTVWFVNMKPKMSMEGVGSAPYSFTTDQRGDAKYRAALGQSPLGHWQELMIVRHPSGNPKDMQHMEDALSAPLM